MRSAITILFAVTVCWWPMSVPAEPAAMMSYTQSRLLGQTCPTLHELRPDHAESFRRWKDLWGQRKARRLGLQRSLQRLRSCLGSGRPAPRCARQRAFAVRQQNEWAGYLDELRIAHEDLLRMNWEWADVLQECMASARPDGSTQNAQALGYCTMSSTPLFDAGALLERLAMAAAAAAQWASVSDTTAAPPSSDKLQAARDLLLAARLFRARGLSTAVEQDLVRRRGLLLQRLDEFKELNRRGMDYLTFYVGNELLRYWMLEG